MIDVPHLRVWILKILRSLGAQSQGRVDLGIQVP